MKKIIGGVTAAQGFEAASAAAHIKYEGRTDMALVFSRTPCVTAGTFTTNVVKAAPVIWDRDLVNSGAPAHAVIVNSGIANACTGQEGMEYCRQTAQEAAACLGIEENSVLVGSTGVIGFQLPIDRIREGVRMLAAARRSGIEAGTEAAKAIMTTDTVHKRSQSSDRRHGQGIRHDPSQHVHNAFLCDDRRRDRKEPSSEGPS